MKSPKTLFSMGMMLGIAFLFSQCRRGNESDPQIPYNPTNAKLHIISIRDAARLTANFRQEKTVLSRQLRDSTFLDKNFNLPLAEKFNRDALAALLDQKGAKGMRIYLGEDKKGQIRLVLVAVNDKGNDITGSDGKLVRLTSNEANDAIALESGQRCPTLCSETGPID
ncbi:hypothetical protein [Pedobacter cryoconitis]|uniref:Uncharacterized protein n=1 Tax=Pedobacter cryoconitis TaxID=188932 RepID=A0A7X0J3U8_9SPHI|nr:hypothetical protein [Pedobacter cryoconitis]MBB6500623.1 hypothetical protein [Pedobacter cryoconitis]